jgi:hypothetical protein
MIIVRLYGGLGNQLFQYSTARRLAHDFGVSLMLDLGSLGKKAENVTPRSYELWRYPIEAGILSPFKTKLAKLYRNRMIKRLPIPRPWKVYREKFFHFDPNLLEAGCPVYLDGYWQSHKYFESIRRTLETELKPSQPMSSDDSRVYYAMQNCNSVSIHVRRGDYISLKAAAATHGTCSLHYYKQAIELIASKIESPKFFVFSDDPEWIVKNIHTNYPIEYVTHNGPDSAFQDLRLISHSQHQIISNSSFGWWGAWLNTNPSKVVVAPAIWFLDNRNTDDIIPANWDRI